MAVAVPAYGAAYSESEQDTGGAAICGYIDADRTQITGILTNVGTALTALANAFAGGGAYQGPLVTRGDMATCITALRAAATAIAAL